MRAIQTILLVGALCAYLLAEAGEFSGLVVGVADGDTVTVLRDREQVRIRMAEIDAPEKAQAFGNKSKQALAALVHGRTVRVDERGRDRYPPNYVVEVVWLEDR